MKAGERGKGKIESVFCLSPALLHPVNRNAHQHAMAGAIEEPISQADTAEPAVPGEGKCCDPLDKDAYGNQLCMLVADL